MEGDVVVDEGKKRLHEAWCSILWFGVIVTID